MEKKQTPIPDYYVGLWAEQALIKELDTLTNTKSSYKTAEQVAFAMEIYARQDPGRQQEMCNDLGTRVQTLRDKIDAHHERRRDEDKICRQVQGCNLEQLVEIKTRLEYPEAPDSSIRLLIRRIREQYQTKDQLINAILQDNYFTDENIGYFKKAVEKTLGEQASVHPGLAMATPYKAMAR